LPREWKESIIVPIYEKGDKTDFSNNLGISWLSTSYKIVSNILLARLSPYVHEIIWDYQCGFRRNRSATDQTFCIRKILQRKYKYSGTVHPLFVDFKKAYDSVTREVLCNILIESGVPMKLVYLSKMCSDETYIKVRIAKHMSDTFSIQMV
jgi:hypothetical protein